MTQQVSLKLNTQSHCMETAECMLRLISTTRVLLMSRSIRRVRNEEDFKTKIQAEGRIIKKKASKKYSSFKKKKRGKEEKQMRVKVLLETEALPFLN